VDQDDNRETESKTPKSRSRGIARRESMAGGLGILAALAGEAIAGRALAQGSAETLKRVPRKQADTTVNQVFAGVIEKALSDPAYAAELKTLASETRQGNNSAAAQLMGVFKLSPSDIKSMNAYIGTPNPNILLTTWWCLTIPITLTMLLSCIGCRVTGEPDTPVQPRPQPQPGPGPGPGPQPPGQPEPPAPETPKEGK
jgi:hypothetical protein